MPASPWWASCRPARRPGWVPPARRPAPQGERRILLDGVAVTAPVWSFEALGADQAVAGPAIIESATTTVLLRAGDTARMDARGWLDVAVG